jgi:hypothetical protein
MAEGLRTRGATAAPKPFVMHVSVSYLSNGEKCTYVLTKLVVHNILKGFEKIPKLCEIEKAAKVKLPDGL